MRRITLGLVVATLGIGCGAPKPEGLEAAIRALAAVPESRRPVAVDALVARFPDSPVIDGRRAVVFWRGEAARVQWIGDHVNWIRETAPDLQRIPGTDLWWGSREFPDAARIDYKFLVDGEQWILDPRCPRTCVGGYGPNSELRMPGYAPPPELRPPAEGAAIPSGRVEEEAADSEALGERRKFWVYVPAGAEGARDLPSVWFHDGDGYLEFGNAARTLDGLIADGRIPPTVAVFVPPVRRGEELGIGGDAYLRFVCDELVPRVRARYRTSADPGKTATIGISLGGLAAVRFALARPEVFGLAAGHSGAYAAADDAVIRDVRDGPFRPVRFHLVVGSFETALGGDRKGGDLLEAQRRLARALAERGYDHQAGEYPEGHSWGLWKARIGDALTFLYR